MKRIWLMLLESKHFRFIRKIFFNFQSLFFFIWIVFISLSAYQSFIEGEYLLMAWKINCLITVILLFTTTKLLDRAFDGWQSCIDILKRIMGMVEEAEKKDKQQKGGQSE